MIVVIAKGKGDIVRILLAAALLGMTASCVYPQPPDAAASPSAAQPVALVPAADPVAAVAVAAPTPVAAPPQQVMAVYAPNPLAWLFTTFAAPVPGRLTLSNFTYESARVQAVITPFGDCQERAGTAISDFEIPLNGTRIIAALPGADVCWRRALLPGPSPTTPGVEILSGWTDWSRAFTSSGRSIDSRL
jgi:hypothetical protein